MANEKGTTVYSLQKAFQSAFGFTLPLFHGRGLLNCPLSLSDPSCGSLTPNLQITWDYCLTEDVSSQLVSPHVRSLPTPLTPAAVGRPIHIRQIDQPNMEEILRVQKLYIDELERFVHVNFLRRLSGSSRRRIWNKYKDDFAKARTRELSIIE